MKKVILFFVLPLLAFTACEGPEGPPGQDGGLYFAQTYEYENVNFTYYGGDNIYSVVLPVPNNIEVFESDAILVYRYEGTIDVNGTTADTWSLLPQNFFLNNGNIIQYVYNHTFLDTEIIIEGNFNLNNLSPAFTSNQIFRFVVVPAEFANTSGVDVTDYNAVMNAVTIED